jgi:REP element-mobilizing transposase RayT
MGFAYKITEQQSVYFITSTVSQWIDVFTRAEYKDIIIKSLKHCQENKGLCIYGWVIMTNHIHLICSCKEGFQLSDTLRDFKKFTSTAIVTAIENNPGESRKNWMIWLLKQKENISFWRPGNHPEEITTREFFAQKLDYIHNNPVRAGWVDKSEDYTYSSARDFYGTKGLIELTDFH